MKRILLTCAVICTMLVAAGMAHAAKIDTWTYSSKAGADNMDFRNFSGTYPPGYSASSATGPLVLNGKTLHTYYKWGETNPTNVLDLGFLRSSGTVNNGQREQIGYSSHTNNQTPTSSAELKYGDMVIAFNLNSGGVSTQVATALHFGYCESLNKPDGTGPDMLFFTDKWLADATRNFIVNEHEYQVKIEVEGRFLEELSGIALTAARSMISSSDYNQKIYGLIIPEGQSYTLNFYSTIDYLGYRGGPVVPIPGAVWLMGTGMAGLVALKRRQKKS